MLELAGNHLDRKAVERALLRRQARPGATGHLKAWVARG
jgi:hypothetical protein